MVRTLDSHPKAIPWVLGKPFYVVTDPHAECEVRMDYVAGPSHNLLAEKKGRIWFYIICLTLYQFERTTWWCLYVLESIIEFFLESALKSFLLKKYLKNHDLPEFASCPPLGGGPDENSGRPRNLIHLAMETSCTAPLTPAMMVMRGFTFHPLLWRECISGSYLVCLCSRALLGNLLCQYTNSMKWIVCVGKGLLVFGSGLCLLICIRCHVSVSFNTNMVCVCMCIKVTMSRLLSQGGLCWSSLCSLVWRIGWIRWLLVSRQWRVLFGCDVIFWGL